MLSSKLKVLSAIATLSVMAFSSAEAQNIKWVPAHQSSCQLVCQSQSGGGWQAVSSGKYKNGNDFWVCSANAHDEGPRAGFNLEPDWSNQCHVAFVQEEAYRDYWCMCYGH